MEQTPVHEHCNPDLLRLIPVSSRNLIEIGCSSGALAREFKKVNPACNYLGIDIDPGFVDLARRYCDGVLSMDIERANEDFFIGQSGRDCWIFGDALEHLKDPWRLLRRIRERLPSHGCVAACIPNAQHWSLIANLSIGEFRYQESGLLDKTHLRWFTRKTIVDLFSSSGFRIVQAVSRIFHEPARDRFLPLIGQLAKAGGEDPAVAVNDAIPVQYVVRAVPV